MAFDILGTCICLAGCGRPRIAWDLEVVEEAVMVMMFWVLFAASLMSLSVVHHCLYSYLAYHVRCWVSGH